jgi:Protein of unknown function (DUF4239)
MKREPRGIRGPRVRSDRAAGCPQHFPGRCAHVRRGELRVRGCCAGGLGGPALGTGDTRGFHAEISAPMLGVAATLFGLLLAFVIIVGYRNFLDADASVSSEADALGSIVRDSAAFPPLGGANVRLAVGTYVRAVVYDEWPRMHDSGKDSPVAVRGLDGISAALRTVNPTSRGETAFYDGAVSQLNASVTARADRLEKAAGGLPRGPRRADPLQQLRDRRLRRVRRISELLVSRARAGRDRHVVAVSLVVLLDLAYPFSGILSISSAHFKTGA